MIMRKLSRSHSALRRWFWEFNVTIGTITVPADVAVLVYPGEPPAPVVVPIQH
jgi:hypothetical protein